MNSEPTDKTNSIRNWSVRFDNLTCLLVLAALVISCLAAKLSIVKGGLFDGFNPFLIEMVSTLWHRVPVDHRRILLAHKYFLLLLAACTLVSAFVQFRFKDSSGLCALRDRIKARFDALTQTFVLCLLAFLVWSCVSFQGTAMQLAAGLPIALAVAAIIYLLRRPSAAVLYLSAGSAIALACVPALLQRPDFSAVPALDVVQLQQHYAVWFSFCDQVAAGIKPDSTWLLHYGVLLPTVLGGIEKCTGVLSFRHLVTIVISSQIVLLVLLFLTLKLLNRKADFLPLLAFATVLPWYHGNQIGISYPNHSGLRLAVALLAISALFIWRRLPASRLSLLMGFLGGLCVLYNFETGVTVCLALALIIFLLRHRLAGGKAAAWPGQRLLQAYALAAFGGLLALVLFVLIYWGVTGSLPVFLNPLKLFSYARTAEIITMPGLPAGVAVLMFGHAAYCLVRTLCRDHSRLTFIEMLRAGIALIVIVWEMYYFNRPYYSNLAGCWLLYSFLLLDSLRVLRLGIWGRRRYLGAAMLAFLAQAAIVWPYALFSYAEATPSYAALWQRLTMSCDQRACAEAIGELVSGVRLPRELAFYVLKKSERLKQLQKKGRLLYVSIYSLCVPKESGLQQDFPYIDPYFGVNMVGQYRQYVARLKSGGVDTVIIDNPHGDPALRDQVWFRNYISALTGDLSTTHRLVETSDYWTVWQRK